MSMHAGSEDVSARVAGDASMDRLYDAIIVGSGAGGAAAAYQLARAGLDVLLLERGADLPRDATTLDIRAVVHEGRFKARERWRDRHGRALEPEEYFNLGGKTRWFGAALLRYSAHEFEADPDHQCRAWPLRYADLRPYYEQAERLLGVRAFACEPDLVRIGQRLEAAATGWQTQPLPMGLDARILDDALEARHFDGFASVAGLKADAQRSFLEPIRNLRNFTLVLNAEVVDLVPAVGRPTTVAGVRTADGAIYRGRRVLLAAGALHSPRLAQRYVEQEGLFRALPCSANIGRHLKLHLLTAVLAISPSRKTDVLRKTTLLTHPALPHSSVQPLGFDGELMSTLIPWFVPRVVARALGERAYGFFLQTEDGSHPDNRVETAAAGRAPLFDYDAERLAPALREHRRLVRRFGASLRRIGMLAFSKRIGLAGTAHACGTMVAGTDPTDSVVDADGRVHGMQGLYVVDGSVLPRSSRVNPSLSIFGWSLRVSDRIAQAAAREGDALAQEARAVGRTGELVSEPLQVAS
jgi:choline dehydrogenase-like flavoprotein